MWSRAHAVSSFWLIMGASGAGCAPEGGLGPGESADGAGHGVIDGAGGAGAGSGGAAGDATGGGGATPAVNQASVITWNLEVFPLTEETMKRVKQTVEELAPDLVAVQEIAEPAAFQSLVSAMEDYEGILNDDPGAFQRVGLLYRKGRVTLDEVETLFPSDWYAFPRPPLLARVTIHDETPIDFYAMVLHLKAQLDDESQARRRDACEKLDAWTQAKLASSAEKDIVMLGDLNDKLTDPPQWNVFSSFLDQPDQYSFLTMPAAEAGEYSYITFEAMIDHVLVTSDMLDEVGAGETEVLKLDEIEEDYDMISDHRPVRTRLRWGE